MNLQLAQTKIRKAFVEAANWIGYAPRITKKHISVRVDSYGNKILQIEDAGFFYNLYVTYDNDNNPRLHADARFASDFHLGTRQCRAKLSTRMYQRSSSNKRYEVGDIVDNVHMREKERFKFAAGHIQNVAEILCAADTGTETHYLPGNHDMHWREQTIEWKGRPYHILAVDDPRKGREIKKIIFFDYDAAGHLRYTHEDAALVAQGRILKTVNTGDQVFHRNLCGKDFKKIKVAERTYYQDKIGRRFLVLHGDEFDKKLFGKHQAYWYDIGGTAYDALMEIDSLVQRIPRCDGISVAAAGKTVIKFLINSVLGVNREIERIVDGDDSIAGVISGHSHMGGFSFTKGGKWIINTGCRTENVQEMVEHNGQWGFQEWRKKRLIISLPNGKKRSVSWDVLDLPSFNNDTVMRGEDDRYVMMAKAMMPLLYFTAPPKERQRAQQEARMIRAMEERLKAEAAKRALIHKPSRPEGQRLMPPMPAEVPRRPRQQRQPSKELAA